MAEIALVTCFTADYLPLAEITVPRIKALARRLNLPCYIFTSGFCTERHPSWSRIWFLREVFKNHDSAWWIDPDALLTRIITKEDIDHWFLHKPGDIICSRDYPELKGRPKQMKEFGLDVQLGSFFLRNTAWSTNFLTDMWNQTDLINHDFEEQAAACRLLSKDGSRAIIEESPTYNRHPRNWRLGDAVCHFAGEPNRPVVMRRFAAEVTTVDCDLTLENAAGQIDRFIVNQLPYYPYPNSFNGRGIVICAGGEKYSKCAYVCLRRLRELGCALPAEIFYLGNNEYDPAWDKRFTGLGARMIDAWKMRDTLGAFNWLYAHRRLNGWELKAYAIMHSSFKEVLFIDADNMPIKNPEFLFDSKEYRSCGTLFWPDRHRLKGRNLIWQSTGVSYRKEPAIESGQIILDKLRTWKALVLCHWMLNQSEYFFRIVYGDKDLFHLAWLKLGIPYAHTSLEPLVIHKVGAKKALAFVQHDLVGDPLFFHNFRDWTPSDMWIEYEALGLAYLRELSALRTESLLHDNS